jgi:hypothetical protein
MQIDDVGTAAIPIVVPDAPVPNTTAELGAALKKVTTFLKRCCHALLSAVVRLAYYFLLLAFANRFCFVPPCPGSGGYCHFSHQSSR